MTGIRNDKYFYRLISGKKAFTKPEIGGKQREREKSLVSLSLFFSLFR